MDHLRCPAAQTTSATIINVVSLVVAVTLLRPASTQVSDLDLPDVMAHAGKVFSLSFQQHPIFGDPRVQTEISLASGDSLPSWLTFNSTSRSLTGLPFSNVQSPILLSVTSSCGLKLDDDHHKASAPDQTCTPRSDVFQITVTKFSLEHSWTPQPNPVSSVLRWSSEAEATHQQPGGDYRCDGDRLIASLVLCVDAGRLRSQERISLVANLAEFLTIPMMTILLEPSTTHSLAVIEKGFQMVAAGPGTDDLCSLEQILEVLWPLPCSSVKHLVDFVRVLQHNVDGGRLQEELGKGVVGWYISSSNSLQTRQNRKRRAAPNRTLVPTPSVALVKPTVVQDSSHYISDATLTTLESTSIPLMSTSPMFTSSTSTAPTPSASVSPASISISSMSTSSSTSPMSISPSSTASMSISPSSTSPMSISPSSAAPMSISPSSTSPVSISPSSTSPVSISPSSTAPMSISPSSAAPILLPSSVQVPFIAGSPESKTDKLLSPVLSTGLSGYASSILSTSLSESSPHLSSTETLIQTSESLNRLGLQVTSSPLDRLPQTSLYVDDVAASARLPLVTSVQTHVDTSAVGPSKLVLQPTDVNYISAVTFPGVDDGELIKSSITTSETFDDQRSILIDQKSFQPGHVDTDDGSLHSSPATVHSVLAPSSPPPHLVQTRTVEIIAPSRDTPYHQRESDSSASIVDLASSQSTNIDLSTAEHDSDLEKNYSGQSLHVAKSESLSLDATSVFLPSRLVVASSFSDPPHTAVEIHDGFTGKATPSLANFETEIYQIKAVTVDSGAEAITISDSTEASYMFGMTTSPSELSAEFTQVLAKPVTLSSVLLTGTDPDEPVSETTLPDNWSRLDSGHVKSSEIITDTRSFFSAVPSVVLIADTPQPPGSSEVILPSSHSSVLASSHSSAGESHDTRSGLIDDTHSEAPEETVVIVDQMYVSSSVTTDLHPRMTGTSSVQYVQASSTITEVSSMTVAVIPVQASAVKVMTTSSTTSLPSSSLSTRRTSSKAPTGKASISSTTANSTKVTTKKSTPRLYTTTADSATTSDWSDTSDDNLYNNRPYVKNPISQITGERGRVFKFAIPPEVFIDVEDGNTRSLRLSLELPSTQELPISFWLYLDHGSQVLKGLPLTEDMGNLSVNLVATDSGGLSERTTISLLINGEGPRDVTHRFNMSFDVDFYQFMRNRRNITNLVSRIGSYFGDSGAKYITVLNVRQGSLRLFWTNNTLSGTACRKDAIMKLYQLLNKTNDLSAHLGQHIKLTQVGLELLGACGDPPNTTTVTMTTLRVGSTLAPGFNIWAHVILPVMIAFLVFVLIILIIIFCNRRRRHRQAIINAEKEAISNDRNPIIFPDEMDGDDPVLQAKDPLLLPTDPHPANQATPQTSPKIERDDDTDGRSRDSRDQEWVDAESRKKGEQKDKPRRHSKDGHRKHHRDKDGRKHSRDKDRMSGVSASSSLTFDRPNNHYLDEEEAGSRNSTLKSNKSGGSEKRHPKQPPPYWQSQSDPPPYRFPPPYLNNTTQV